MANFARLYKANQALVVHATATGYRDRSHFDGQDVLESGQAGAGPHRQRLDEPGAAGAAARASASPCRGGLGVGPMTPLVMRGAAPVLGWAPQSLPKADEELAARVLDLYSHRDPALASALMRGLDTDRMAIRSGLSGDAAKPRGGADSVEGMKHIAGGAARLLAQDDGPRLAALAFDGWDTHANEGGATGRLAQLLSGLDAALGDVRGDAGPALGGYRDPRRHRIRPHGEGERHRRHRPRHGDGRVPGGRGGEGRAHHRGLAGPEDGAAP